MFKGYLATVFCASACVFLLTACVPVSKKLVVVSPEQGQLIRDASIFQVEVEIDEAMFDPNSLQAELNGVFVPLSGKEGSYVSSLTKAQSLDTSNQLIVTANRLADGVQSLHSVEFSWAPLPEGTEFSDEFVKNPPPIETAELEMLQSFGKRQNALLHVTFKEGFDAPANIPYRADAQSVFILSDSGEGDDSIANDGHYTARVDFDYENYRNRKTREVFTASFDTANPGELTFSGRHLKAKKAPTLGPTLVSLAAPTTIALAPAVAAAPVVDSERALMIRDLSVIADPSRTFDPCDTDADGLTGNPNGAWSFKTLMANMANTLATGVPLDLFVQQWLMGWAQNFDLLHEGSASGDWIINDDVVPHREAGLIASIINPWPKTSAGTLDMDQAPFRLLAIVNRVDLRDAVGYGSSTSTAGELRFVFGLLDMNSCTPDRMTAIFEYTVHANTCPDVLNYAQDWEDLDLLHPPFPASPGYLAHLQSITDPVTNAGAAPLEPNGSSIGQLRTSEVVMSFPWEMREFTLQPIPFGTPIQNVLRMDTTKQTPDREFTVNAALQPILENFINSNLGDICDSKHTVPDTFSGMPFMAGRADFFPDSHFWAPGIASFPSGGCTDDDIRFNFSVNTCSGCHGGDAIDPGFDPPFYHVDPTSPGATPVRLSRFLTGTGASPIPDPSPIGGIGRDFADLDRRAVDLQDLLATGCVGLAVASPMLSTH